MKTFRRRGVALLTVVMMTFLLAMLTSALMGNHQSNFAILGDSINQRYSTLAASSGLDYAKYRLGRERTLGQSNASFAGAVTRWGDLEITEGVNQPLFRGHFVNSTPRRDFEVQIENYLDRSGAPADLSPASAVRLKIVGMCGPFHTQIETTLVGAPLYDSACIANKAIDMASVTNWTIDSQDPLRNWIRSNEEICTPDFLSGGKTMEFLKSKCPNPGVGWSKKDVYVGEKANNVIVDGGNFADVFASTKGLMAPNSNLNYNIYDLKLKDLKKPAAPDVEIPAGTYTVNTTTVTYVDNVWEWRGWGHGDHWEIVETHPGSKTIPDLVYTDPSGTPQHILKQADVPQPGWTDHHGWRRTERTNVVLPSNNKQVGSSVVNISNNFSSDNFTFNFDSSQFSATNANPLHVSGDLTVNSNTTIPTIPSPNVNFVSAVGTEPGFIYSSAGATAASGSIKVQGTVAGRGGVAAHQDLTMGANSNLSADAAHLGLVLWAGRDITFDVQNGSDMLFRGLVYAKNNVALKFAGAPGTASLNNLVLEGSLVAQSGSMIMGDAKNVKMNYDPAYLELFTNGLPDGTARFAQVSFKLY
ncbi:hypothetical protein IV102_28670 [bacterium]|nr:hypothetical protein [bacterium]